MPFLWTVPMCTAPAFVRGSDAEVPQVDAAQKSVLVRGYKFLNKRDKC